ncbi:MAG TPA: hypothetical protein IAA79_08645 [Candidatus Avirikenella pullistercoris]|nr:hypothetical protein [Candidatus Avirikenella pullistercoris]
MATISFVLIIAIIAVAFLIFSLSITIIRKGHPIQSEVGENDEMKKRGLKCATQEIMEEEQALRGGKACDDKFSCGLNSCSDCTQASSSKGKE